MNLNVLSRKDLTLVRRILLGLVAGSLAVSIAAPRPAWAQVDILSGKPLLGGGKSALAELAVVSASADFTTAAAGQRAQLFVTAQITPLWHIYSITQQPGGPVRTKIALDGSDSFRVMGEFRPTAPPRSYAEPLFGGLVVETHESQVTWVAPIELKSGVDPKTVQIAGRINAQACNDQTCLPAENFAFIAALRSAGAFAAAVTSKQSDRPAQIGTQGAFADASSHAVIRGHIEPRVAAPGTIAKLVLRAEPAADWHIYALAGRDPQGISKPTVIGLADTSGLRFKAPVPSARPIEEQSELPDGAIERYYTSPVDWTIEIEVPRGAKGGSYPISGVIGYQTCRRTGCDLPRGARFDGNLTIGVPPVGAPSGQAALAFREAKYFEAAQLAAKMPVPPGAPAPAAQDSQAASLLTMILPSLLGGLILNLMPCVLPVIGLKILSFVQQSGQHRRQVLMLNLWYSLGLILVFIVLATLAAFLNLGWGQQFQSTPFNVAMAAVVFVMALSFLGVWEIPIPGFLGSGKATELAAREGAAGAFSKGVLTTLLATPCSGPFLGPVFGFTLKQPPYVTYVVFGCIGLGMASPYLLIGAFPRLIRFLPKPGPWMDTFKQMMGFVLLGTIVYLFTLMKHDYLVPTFALLIGLWASCWWIGRTPLYAGSAKILRAWVAGAAFAAMVGWFAFRVLVPGEPLLAWQPFSRPTLAQLTAEGKTVMVDFTANWCPTCQFNWKFAINTDEVRRAVEANGVVPLIADWSEESDEIKQALAALGSNSIPVTAIFPANRPYPPIVLRDLLSKQQVVDAIKQAGPSQKKLTQTLPQ